MYKRMRTHPFWRRLQDRPFAAALAMLLMTSPIVTAAGASLAHDPLKALVPPALFYAILVLYFASGLLLFLGLGCNKTNFEAAGCALAVSSLAIRLLALVSALGFTIPVLATAGFYIVFGGACVERFVQCVKGDHIVRVSKVVSLEATDGD